MAENAWQEIEKTHGIDSITDTELLKEIQTLRNHFMKPEYIVYFKEGPEELIACDYYAIRAVYNRNICDDVLDGLSPQLSNEEQMRVRNRVLALIKNYQCEEGAKRTELDMQEPAVYSKAYKTLPCYNLSNG